MVSVDRGPTSNHNLKVVVATVAVAGSIAVGIWFASIGDLISSGVFFGGALFVGIGLVRVLRGEEDPSPLPPGPFERR